MHSRTATSITDDSTPASAVRLHHNAREHRFEASVDGVTARLDYEMRDDRTLALVHTDVPNALQGHGIGSHLVQAALEYADAHDLRVLPVCAYVRCYMAQHPGTQRLLPSNASV